MDKLFVIVDGTLSTGLKMAQAIHAFKTFQVANPYIETRWFHESNNIVVLEHEDIAGIAHELEGVGMAVSRFHEPDLDDQLTAFAVEPRAWKYLSNIKLAG